MRKAIRSPLLALALIVVFAGTALATVASGFHPTLLARGTMSEEVHFNTGAVKFQTKGAVDFATATVSIAPGGSSGWHSHPGVVLVTVKSGTVTFYDEHCTGIQHAAGTSFVESGEGAGLGRNESLDTTTVLYVTYVVPAGAPLRIDKANPGCPQS